VLIGWMTYRIKFGKEQDGSSQGLFRELYQHFHGWTEEKRRSTVRIAGDPAETRT
jgi:hypothetical protein